MEPLSKISAAILVGGRGTRLQSVVADRPKSMALVKGRPFLNILLDGLIAAGIRHTILCTGYKHELIEALYGPRYGEMDLSYSAERAAAGTGGALRLAQPLFKSDVILAMNGDSYCDVDLVDFWKWHSHRGSDASLVATEVPDTSRHGRLQIDPSDRILRFEEKAIAHGNGWINAGVYLLGARFLSSIPSDREVSIEREVFPEWLTEGLYAFRHCGMFFDIGTPESYARVNASVARAQ